MIKNLVQGDGCLNFFLGVIGKISCLKATVLEGSQEVLQQFRPRLNQGGSIYTKGKVFDFDDFGSGMNFSMSVMVIFTLLAPSRSQLKSNN
jgi:hypothetical protein